MPWGIPCGMPWGGPPRGGSVWATGAVDLGLATTSGKAVTRSRKASPRTSKLGYWSKLAQAGDSSTTGWGRPEAAASRLALLAPA